MVGMKVLIKNREGVKKKIKLKNLEEGYKFRQYNLHLTNDR